MIQTLPLEYADSSDSMRLNLIHALAADRVVTAIHALAAGDTITTH